MNDLVSSITNCHETQDLLNAHGLQAQRVTWEDTGRTKGSCWGPNISDMTLLVKEGSTLMPVIRKPNFSDVTQDVPIDTFRLKIGNNVLSLRDFLSNVNVHVDDVKDDTNLFLERDEVILTSSQCCVLPVKKGEKTEFALQLFNYQSYDEDPAVLVLMVSSRGTSVQVLERSNQKLFFNDKGTAKWFNIERLEDVRERKGETKTRVDSFKEMKQEEKMDNTLMMIQIPLKQKPRPQTRGMDGALCLSFNNSGGMACQESCAMALGPSAGFRSLGMTKKKKVKGRGMDMGQLGLGSSAGRYVGTKGLKLTRDDRFPIRCTFQYYRVTDENFITEKNIVDISEQISQATAKAVATGSLVCNDESKRATEPDLDHPKPSDDPFGKLNERDYLEVAPMDLEVAPVVAPVVAPFTMATFA